MDHGIEGEALEQHDHESQLRMLRFASIDLQKFWVEVQSFPVFLNTVKGASIVEIERIHDWMQASPAWNALVRLPRLIPELVEPERRRALLELLRDVRSLRALREQLGTRIELGAEVGAQPGRWAPELPRIHAMLSRASALCESQGAGGLDRGRLEESVAEASDRLEQVLKIQAWLLRLNEQTGAPLPDDAEEALRLFHALDCVAKIPKNLRRWRQPQILDSAQRIRLQTWQDRARPLLESRKRLAAVFQLGLPVEPDTLRKIAGELQSTDLFRRVRASFREALAEYRRLLKGECAATHSKETPFQMGERLLEWANFLEQSRTFETHVEARAAFAPHFRGIDTDFSSACETNAWATLIRAELVREHQADVSIEDSASVDVWGQRIRDFVFQLPAEKVELTAGLAGGHEARLVRELLSLPEITGAESLAALRVGRERAYSESRELEESVTELGLRTDLPLGELQVVCQLADDLLFLTQRVNLSDLARDSLKQAFAGADTDLGLIEQAVAFVKAVQSSELPEALKISLLSAHGPQKIADARAMTRQAAPALLLVREHFRRLDAVTRGGVRELADGEALDTLSVQRLLERMQDSLRRRSVGATPVPAGSAVERSASFES